MSLLRNVEIFILLVGQYLAKRFLSILFFFLLHLFDPRLKVHGDFLFEEDLSFNGMVPTFVEQR